MSNYEDDFTHQELAEQFNKAIQNFDVAMRDVLAATAQQHSADSSLKAANTALLTAQQKARNAEYALARVVKLVHKADV